MPSKTATRNPSLPLGAGKRLRRRTLSSRNSAHAIRGFAGDPAQGPHTPGADDGDSPARRGRCGVRRGRPREAVDQVAVRQNSSRSLIVTIDGPAGVGKSTVAKLLAKALGVMYLDTGATYRALAYAAVKAKLNPITEAHRLAALARQLPLQLRATPAGGLRVMLDGIDVTKQIRTEEVSEAAAQVSQYPEVRAAMVELQRELANRHGVPRLHSGRHPERSRMGGVVVEGRDTGSVVFPHATYKFFLDADPVVRAKRRQLELAQLYGVKSPLLYIKEQLHFRDSLDRSRRVGPLLKPAGAIKIDTSHLTALEVVRVMLRHIRHTSESIVRSR